MLNIVDWIKHNKLATVLVIVVLFLIAGRSPFYFLNNLSTNSRSFQTGSYEYGAVEDTVGMAMAPTMAVKSIGGSGVVRHYGEAAPQAQITDRMVASTSYLSLVVKDVSASVVRVKDFVVSIGGYMVNSSISRPEEGGTGTLTVRIPSVQLDNALKELKGMAVKTVSENLEGTDVTDQFVDNEARLIILERNKAKFEEIMEKAEKIDEILRVQNEIFSLQSQIDSIKGQQLYLTKTAEMAKITIYLSTDELALPYAPTNTFRPEVVFKKAVRHLVGTLQSVLSMVIWIGVYSVIWVPILIIIILIPKRRRHNTSS